MTTAVKLTNVRKRYGREVALDGVSLEIPTGSVVALLGENGAGKSTTLKIALGLTDPDEGSAEVFGLDSRTYGREIRQRVGYVPETPAFYNWMTVAEIGWFTAGFHPPGFEERFREFVDRFDVPAGRKISGLAKGMRAKVGLALALAPNPELLILDEPTSGLDPVVRRAFLENIADVAADGRTVLLSSHQINEVERVADRIIVVRKGKYVLDAEVASLKDEAMELTVTFADAAAAAQLGEMPTGLLRRLDRERQSRLLFGKTDRDWIPEFRRRPGVRDVAVRSLSLEEFYFAFMAPDGADEQSLAAGGRA